MLLKMTWLYIQLFHLLKFVEMASDALCTYFCKILLFVLKECNYFEVELHCEFNK